MPWTGAALAAAYALAAAVAWGSGDFTGGVVTRRVGPFHTVLLSYAVGLVALAAVALVRGEHLPPPPALVWGAVAGLSGMVGLGFLFQGFAGGRMGIVAPVSAVLATALPVLFTAATEGLPRTIQLLGFGLALASIWLLSRPDRIDSRPAGIGLGLLAGLGFGGFFIALDQVGEGAVFWPLVAGRLAACALMLALAAATRRPVIPAIVPLGLLALAGILDVAGNLFFLLAIQSGRLDVAAVLVSFYPAVTALLARVVTKEHLARLQVIGVATAVLAIALITR
jgi:drug/metabolite transporter (DMT)-like permease